jgi:hypothetical protein
MEVDDGANAEHDERRVAMNRERYIVVEWIVVGRMKDKRQAGRKRSRSTAK